MAEKTWLAPADTSAAVGVTDTATAPLDELVDEPLALEDPDEDDEVELVLVEELELVELLPAPEELEEVLPLELVEVLPAPEEVELVVDEVLAPAEPLLDEPVLPLDAKPLEADPEDETEPEDAPDEVEELLPPEELLELEEPVAAGSTHTPPVEVFWQLSPLAQS